MLSSSTSYSYYYYLFIQLLYNFPHLHTFPLLQRPPKLSLGLPHPDPVVETSSLSAVQPPEPTYELNIMDELDKTKTLSCLQIETLVYACQVSWHSMIRLFMFICLTYGTSCKS
jgi:hypothetical protein